MSSYLENGSPDISELVEFIRILEMLPEEERTGFAKTLLKGNSQHTTQRLSLALALVVVLVLGLLATLVLVLFKGEPDMVQKILLPVITFIAGAGGGYGFAKSKREK